MKTRILSLSLLTVACLMVAAAPVMADNVLYSNGPYNGTTDAWTINSGFSVSDSFTVSSASTVTYAGGVFWLLQGDTLTSADISFGTTPFGNDLGNFVGITPVENIDLGSNQFGFELWRYGWHFPPFPPINCYFPPCDIFLTMANASTPNGDPVYWDENSGPSTAYENTLGTIPSESFTIFGTPIGTTPEPSGILLFGSGILALAGALRRTLKL